MLLDSSGAPPGRAAFTSLHCGSRTKSPHRQEIVDFGRVVLVPLAGACGAAAAWLGACAAHLGPSGAQQQGLQMLGGIR